MLYAFWALGFLSLPGRLSVAAGSSNTGFASWYGEEHRGKLMANGKKFDPDAFTAASWFYPLGTKLRVTVVSRSPALVEKLQAPTSVLVTVTDRGPAKHFVRDGRIIDLSHASFKRLVDPKLGLVAVAVEPVDDSDSVLSIASTSP
jgi:rare lipoprotein A